MKVALSVVLRVRRNQRVSQKSKCTFTCTRGDSAERAYYFANGAGTVVVHSRGTALQHSHVFTLINSAIMLSRVALLRRAYVTDKAAVKI